jgi:hypothetical protein
MSTKLANGERRATETLGLDRGRSGKRLAAYAAAGAVALGTGAAAQAQQQMNFDGPYAHANWSFMTGSDAFFSPTMTSLTLTGANAGIGDTATYTIAAVASGMVNFSWTYTSEDVGNWDYAGFVLNGMFTTLANNAAAPTGGSFSTMVNIGDTFGFFVTTQDGQFGRGTIAITNFAAPVPEPSTLGLLALGTIGGALAWRRRRKAVNGLN